MSQLKTYTAESFQEVNTHDAPRSFYEQLFALQEISIKLSRAPTLDDLYRTAVEEAINTLNIDRLGVLLIDGHYMQGTWGTDEHGNVRSEAHFRSPMIDEVYDNIAELSTRGKVCVWHDVDIYEFSRDDHSTSDVIGSGWNASIGFWENDQLVGWITCDNLLSQAPFELYFTYILRLFGQLVGELILKKKAEESVRYLNQDLQAKNSVLERTIEDLNQAQQALVTAKIQASLKDVVVGVAHGLNTPIGVATTAITSGEEKVAEVKQKLAVQQLKKSELSSALDYVEQAAQLSLKNLVAASNMIREFKRLSVFEHLEASASRDYEISDLVQQALSQSTQGELGLIDITLNDHSQQHRIHTALEPVVQVLQDLILNAYQHGELGQDNQLIIEVHNHAEWLYLDVINTNKTIAKDLTSKIFDPFVTTARAQGKMGLGLNVARNIATQVLGGDLTWVAHPTHTIFRLSLPR